MPSSGRERVGENRAGWLNTNQAIGLVGALVSVGLGAYLLLTPQTFLRLSDGFYLGFFPLVAVSLLGLTTSVMMADGWRHRIPPDIADLSVHRFLAVVMIAATAWGYFWLMRKVGFLVATPLFLGLSLYVLGVRSWARGTIAMIGFTVVGYLLVWALDLPSLQGPLGDLIPF